MGLQTRFQNARKSQILNVKYVIVKWHYTQSKLDDLH